MHGQFKLNPLDIKGREWNFILYTVTYAINTDKYEENTLFTRGLLSDIYKLIL